MAQPLEVHGVPWNPVSPKLTSLKQLSNAVGTLILTAILALPLILRSVDIWSGLWSWLGWGMPLVALVWGIVEAFIIPRRVKAMGYAEREDDLLLKSGILFRTVVAIPYGRLQYLDVSSGPLQRLFKVRSVEINTASVSTSGKLEGIPPEEAERLREQLTARGQARLAGL